MQLPVTVPPPEPPESHEAWYTSNILEQYELVPGTVVTIKQDNEGIQYNVREPLLTNEEKDWVSSLESDAEDSLRSRPLTQEGIKQRMTEWELSEATKQRIRNYEPAAQRRLRYFVLRDKYAVGEITPLAIDQNIKMADVDDETLFVQTERYAPVETEFDSTDAYISRCFSRQLANYTVDFCDYEIPVVIYKEQIIGRDTFTIKYAVREPTLQEREKELIEGCKDRIWKTNVDGIIENRTEYIKTKAHDILRQLSKNQSTTDGVRRRIQSLIATFEPDSDSGDSELSEQRVSALVYYILRDFIGEGKLTIPIRDPQLEDIEANKVGERIKVVPRTTVAEGKRIPTNLQFDDEQEFTNIVTQIAASDGVELTASNPSAKVNLEPAEVKDDVTIRCAVGLPVISEGGPHVSIRKQAFRSLTPIDLIQQDTIPQELVALLWMLHEHRGVILYSGSTGVGKTTLMNAHMPFIRFDDRAIAIDGGSREVRLPHETGVELSTKEYGPDQEDITMASLMTECNYLNPDVEIIAEINTPESFRTYAESINTGHGLIGTVHADDPETLVNRMVEQGISPHLLQEIDLVVFPRHINGERYVGEVIEFLDPDEFEAVDGPGGEIVKEDTRVCWNRVCVRDEEGAFRFAYSHPQLGDQQPVQTSTKESEPRLRHSAFEPADKVEHAGANSDEPSCDMRIFHQIAGETDRSVQAVEAEFHKKLRYTSYLTRSNISDFKTLFEFLADLQTDETATVDRLQRMNSGEKA